jgi:hypothetical protein
MTDGRQELKPAYHHQAIPRVEHQQSSSSISRSSAKIEKIHTKLSGFSKVPPQTVTLGHMIPETGKLGEFLFFAQSTSRGTTTSDRKFRCPRGMADPTYKYCGENPDWPFLFVVTTVFSGGITSGLSWRLYRGPAAIGLATPPGSRTWQEAHIAHSVATPT